MAVALESQASPQPELEELLIVKLGEDAWRSEARPQEKDRDPVPGPEASRQRFRQFQYRDASGPHEVFSQLWALCCHWLRPEVRLKEQILELLVLEQFLTILPREVQAWVQARHPESGEEAVALVEDWHREARAAGHRVRQIASLPEVGQARQRAVTNLVISKIIISIVVEQLTFIEHDCVPGIVLSAFPVLAHFIL